jgi:hypothetical protein
MRTRTKKQELMARSRARPVCASIVSRAVHIIPTQVQRRVRGAETGRTHRNLLLLPLIALAALAASAAPALAAPMLAITMEHHNAYGLQASECPGGHESLTGEPDCGVDPYTGSGTTFVQESGFNTYTIHVKNAASGGLGQGATLQCEPGTWEGSPTFSYHWLRNGAVIAGAEESEYTLTAEDEGTALQCQVTGSDSGGAMAVDTPAISAEPTPSTAPPVVVPAHGGGAERSPKVHGPGGGVEAAAPQPEGTPLTCEAGEWSGNPAFSYRWLRNGSPIAGATSDVYTVSEADKGDALQCQVTATNAGGSTSATGFLPIVAIEEPPEYPPYTENEVPRVPGPALKSGSEISGTVTVADQLPEGMVLEGANQTNGADEVSGVGWSCAVGTGARTFTCTRSDVLPPGESYPPISAHVTVQRTAASSVTNVAAASGGGAATADVYDPTIVSPAVPFGIEQFTTAVTDQGGSPFTQAGGHPIAANATFVFNRTVSNRLLNDVENHVQPTLEIAGGTPKDIETELPPGFLGDTQNAPQCTTAQAEHHPAECSRSTVVGFATINSAPTTGSLEGGRQHAFPSSLRATVFIYNRVPAPGSPANLGFSYSGSNFALTAKLRSDGDYGVTIADTASGRGEAKGLQALSLTLCSYGVEGYANEPNEPDGGGQTPATAACAAASEGTKPFLTNPTECIGPAPTTELRVDTYQDPVDYASKVVFNGTSLTGSLPSPSESFLTGCSQLSFRPEVEFKPSPGTEGGTTQADEPTGATFALKVPQTNEAGVNATPELKDATVTLPEGMTVDPSSANGLQVCSNAQFGLGSTSEPAEPAACPLASQIGTVEITTPLLEEPLEGQVFIGEPECSPCSATDAEDGHIFRLFLQSRLPERGVIVKLAGKVSANPTTGRLQATFAEQPQLPFSELLLSFNGGARAPLANPQTCGTFTTTTDLTPWSTSGLGGPSGSEPIVGTPDATPSSSFAVDSNGQGGRCAGMAFAPTFAAGSQTTAAASSSSFSVTFGREDREQDISSVTLTTPPGLLGKVSEVSQCAEAQANAGTCGADSLIGSTTVGAGPGADPFYLGGKVYLTGPYKGQPFGLSIVVPAIAGPFNLGTVVVRASIAVNPSTSQLTITTDPLPQYLDGVQLRLRRIDVTVERAGFMLNPTSCAQQSIAAAITAAQGASSSVSTPFEVGGCGGLGFAPKLTATTQAMTSKAKGASLDVSIRSAPGQANIAKVDLQLPKTFPTRDSTLEQACTEAQFNSNPAGCPEGSTIGMATAITPILDAPLTGPAYLVSHGGAAFPDVEFVLQGEGVTIVLDGKTDIKDGVTYSRFESVPDAPISSFETSFPEGPHSILGSNLPESAKYSLCGRSLSMPTIITAQNGRQIKQTTRIAVEGCKASKPLTKTQKLMAALKRCRRDQIRKKRATCEARARKRYEPLKKTKKTAKNATHTKGSK